MFIDKTVTYVECDGCGTGYECRLGENLSWDQRMNACLAKGYTFTSVDGVFKNHCRKCVKEGVSK